MSRRGENIYKRKDGRYEGRYVKSYSDDGKARYGYVYGRTYREVKNRLNELKVKYQNKRRVVSSDLTVEEWVGIWLRDQSHIKDSSRMTYNSYLKNHLAPELGEIKLGSLTNEELQKFVNKKLESLSVKTVKDIFNMLRGALKAAYDKNLLQEVVWNVKLPKNPRPKIQILNWNEQRALEKAIDESDDPNDIGILICLYTGLRICELCALRWENVDLDRGIMSIVQTLQRIENDGGGSKTKIKFDSPKSLSSVRDVPIPKFLVERLKKIEKDGGYVISANGKFIEPRVYSRRLDRLLSKLGIPHIKFHSLRHSFSTRALEIGFDVKTLSEILGHSSASITLNFYAHSMCEHKRKEIERLGKEFYSPSK